MQKIVKFLKSSLRPVAFEYFLVAAAVSLDDLDVLAGADQVGDPFERDVAAGPGVI